MRTPVLLSTFAVKAYFIVFTLHPLWCASAASADTLQPQL